MAAKGTAVLAALGGAATLAVQYARLEAADRRGAAVEAELAREREHAQGLEAEVRRLQGALEDERSKSPARRDNLAALELRLSEARVENRELHARLDLEQADSAQMRGELEQLGADLDRVRGESDMSKQQWMSEKAAFTQRVDGMMQTLTREQAQGEELTERLRALDDEKLALEAELAHERQTVKREQAQGQELTERLRAMSEEKLALETELANQRRANASVDEQLGKVKAELASEREEQEAAMEELNARLRLEQQQRVEEQALAAGAQEMLSRKLAQVRTNKAPACMRIVGCPGPTRRRLAVAACGRGVETCQLRAAALHQLTLAHALARAQAKDERERTQVEKTRLEVRAGRSICAACSRLLPVVRLSDYPVCVAPCLGGVWGVTA